MLASDPKLTTWPAAKPKCCGKSIPATLICQRWKLKSPTPDVTTRTPLRMNTSPLSALRVPDVVYRFYERRLAGKLTADQLPGHIGVVLDGYRRWAKQTGASTAYGHHIGAGIIIKVRNWVT